MVLLESQQLGHNVFITSYTVYLKTFLEDKLCDKFEKYFHYMADVSIEYCRKNCRFPIYGNGPYLVNHITRLVSTFMNQHKPKNEEEEHVIPENIEERLINSLVFGCIWGIGGVIDESTRMNFDKMFQELIAGEDVVATYEIDLGPTWSTAPMKIPNKLTDCTSLFDVCFDQEEMRWASWMSTVPKYVINKEETYL